MNSINRILPLIIISFFGIEMTAQEINKTHSMGGIEVTITGISSDKGTMIIGLYNTQEHFLKDPLLYEKPKAKEGTVTISFNNLEPGEYAISLFHDKNDNGKLDTNMLGIPTEPYGTSNNAKGLFGPPKWHDAKFTVKDVIVHQIIKL